MAPGLATSFESLSNMINTTIKKEPLAKEVIDATSSFRVGKVHAAPHPLDPLSEQEIRDVGRAIRKHFTEVSSQTCRLTRKPWT
jgi:Cu2+-containing amine oxidase